MRVKQQNLVYVIGLIPSIKDEHALLQTLRGPEYFGQYGEIEKIVVSKAKPGATNQGIGVYVTFARKEDAALCINTVDGSSNGDRVLRAQFGTTKYCSAYLRSETCTNKNCSFLHETGEDGQSSSLQNEPHGPKIAYKASVSAQTAAIAFPLDHCRRIHAHNLWQDRQQGWRTSAGRIVMMALLSRPPRVGRQPMLRHQNATC